MKARNTLLRLSFAVILVVGIVTLVSFVTQKTISESNYAQAEDSSPSSFRPYTTDNPSIKLANNILSSSDDHLIGAIYDKNLTIYCYTTIDGTDSVYKVTVDQDLNVISSEFLFSKKVLDYVSIDSNIYCLLDDNDTQLYKFGYDYITFIQETSATKLYNIGGKLCQMNNHSIALGGETYALPLDNCDITYISNGCIALYNDDTFVIAKVKNTLEVVIQLDEVFSCRVFNVNGHCIVSCLIDANTLVLTEIDDDNIIFSTEIAVSSFKDIYIEEQNNTIVAFVYDDSSTIRYTLCRHGDILNQELSDQYSVLNKTIDYTLYTTSAQNIELEYKGKIIIFNGNDIAYPTFVEEANILIIETSANMLDYSFNLGGSDIYLFKV